MESQGNRVDTCHGEQGRKAEFEDFTIFQSLKSAEVKNQRRVIAFPRIYINVQ